MRLSFIAHPLFLGLVIVACGGATTSPAPAPVRSPECPATVPATGTSCPSIQNLECEYGADIHCTQIATCTASVEAGSRGAQTPVSSTGFTWFVRSSDPSCGGNSAACGASYAKVVNGSTCIPGDSCTFPEGRCSCAQCFTNGDVVGGQWSCEEWETPKGCPADRPLLGTACSTEGEECDYGATCCDDSNVGPAMKCVGGFWTNDAQSCACGVSLCGNP